MQHRSPWRGEWRQRFMRANQLDFDLPAELIAQVPAADRAGSRLLHYSRGSGAMAHHRVGDLPRLLRRGDLLVFNDTKVLPARFVLRKETGGRIEGLFLRQEGANHWQVMLRRLERYRGLLHFEADKSLTVRVLAVQPGGICRIEVSTDEPAAVVLERIGRMPMPPYIHRDWESGDLDLLDRERYQTLYARSPGSVAAPTAGLHFTPQLLADLDAAGMERATVTLHVGLGTFKPVTADDLADHVMHAESYEIDEPAAEALNRAESDSRRVIAVGTTSARVLESHPAGERWQPTKAETSIFIYPPYSWRHVKGLMTNFHLPRSTLIALVAAFVGLEKQRAIYAEAIAQRYRFFSYGDAMLAE
jgi:S-adenosylmethionine:tRNA ribosyltransferase-isomerase